MPLQGEQFALRQPVSTAASTMARRWGLHAASRRSASPGSSRLRRWRLTRLLLEHGADPDDDETPYHVPETTDNKVLQVLLDSGRLSEASLCTMLLRKSDWHDLDGMANPNILSRWGIPHRTRRYAATTT